MMEVCKAALRNYSAASEAARIEKLRNYQQRITC
jgi:hypothetical protein